MSRYDRVICKRNEPGAPWPWTAHGYDEDATSTLPGGELVWINSADGDTEAEARAELLNERKPR